LAVPLLSGSVAQRALRERVVRFRARVREPFVGVVLALTLRVASRLAPRLAGFVVPELGFAVRDVGREPDVFFAGISPLG
jgi:hypothetical protein